MADLNMLLSCFREKMSEEGRATVCLMRAMLSVALSGFVRRGRPPPPPPPPPPPQRPRPTPHPATIPLPPDISFLKHDSSTFRHSSNPVCGSWESQLGQTAQILTRFIVEKPHAGLDACLNMLPSCFRKRMFVSHSHKFCMKE